MASNDAPSASEIDAKLQQLEKRIDTLKRRYERYFLGIDQKPPRNMRKQVFREVMELENTYISNTAQRFQLRTLVQKFNTNKTRWNRILRQIEEGTYIRDRKRAERRKQKRRREQENQPRADKNDQGAIELNPDDDFIEGIEELDMEEVFDSPKEPQQPHHPNEPRRPNEPRPSTTAQQPSSGASPPRSAADKQRIKQQRLAEIQRKLGLSGNDSAPTAASSSSNASKSSAKTPAPSRPTGPRKGKAPSRQRRKKNKPLTKRQKKLKKLQRNLDRNSSKRRSSPKNRPRQDSSGRRVVRRSQSSSPSKED